MPGAQQSTFMDPSTLLVIQICLQTVTAGAIVTSVIYAGRQLRNWHRAQQVANFTKLVELQMALRRLRVDNPELAKVHSHDVEGLKSDEEIRLYFLNLMQLSVFEIAWFSHRMGQLGDGYFASWEKRMRVIEREPSFRQMWNKPSMKILHDEFEAYIRELMKQG